MIRNPWVFGKVEGKGILDLFGYLLIPLGLEKGTGYFGILTRKMANKLMGL